LGEETRQRLIDAGVTGFSDMTWSSFIGLRFFPAIFKLNHIFNPEKALRASMVIAVAALA
jgi:hypothetical protein